MTNQLSKLIKQPVTATDEEKPADSNTGSNYVSPLHGASMLPYINLPDISVFYVFKIGPSEVATSEEPAAHDPVAMDGVDETSAAEGYEFLMSS